MDIPKYAMVHGHEHNFGHATFIRKGGFHIHAETKDGRIFDHDYWAGEYVAILAGVKHEFTSLEDGSAYDCLFIHRDPMTGLATEVYTGWVAAVS